MNPLLLASNSAARWGLLVAAGVQAERCSSGVDERPYSAACPGDLAVLLAREKASAVARLHPGRLVLGADQVVIDPASGEAWGKPDGAGQHLRRLLAMRGRWHRLVTGWALVDPSGGMVAQRAEARLHMRADLLESELAAYVETGEASQCAGGYAFEGKGGALFDGLEGEYSNVLGLPMRDVISALRRRGWRMGT